MSNGFGSRRRLRKAGIVGSLVAAFAALAVAVPSALGDQRVINSSGPLTNIYLDDNLACQVAYAGDQSFEFFDPGVSNPGDCGTFISTGGASDGPDNLGAGNNGIHNPYHLVSQTPVSGSGTSADPYTVVTVVDILETDGVEEVVAQVGTPILTITQTDTYVVGDQFYRTHIEVRNETQEDINATLYHAADCYLQNSDVGFGFYDSSSGGIYCTANPNNSPAGRFEGFVPLDEGSHYFEADYYDVWTAIDATADQFPDSVNANGDPANPGTAQDNGAGLSWPLTIGGDGGTVTRSLLTTFSSGAPPPGTIAQQPPPQCKLRISRARVFLFSRHPRLRLVARYRSADPADVLINFIAVEGGNKVNLGDVTRHFYRHGLFRLREELSQQQADTLWHTDRFVVHFKIPGEPGFCARKYKKELTVPRIIDGQRVVFQSDSSFGSGPGHPEH